MIGLLVSVLLSTVVIAVVSAGKTTVFSPYENGSEYEAQQLTFMRESLDDFTVANTMSTPMLVNDWQNPHRTLLVIAAPEKPFDAAEAAAIHDFVRSELVRSSWRPTRPTPNSWRKNSV